jgi:hypothetical protein
MDPSSRWDDEQGGELDPGFRRDDEREDQDGFQLLLE